MIDGTYLVEVDTPLGRKSGMLVMSTKGNKLEAQVDAPIIGKQQAFGKVDGQNFSVSGAVKVLLKGEITYSVEGTVSDGLLIATLKSSKGDLQMVGARL